MQGTMILLQNDDITIIRKPHIITVTLNRSHRVVSTSRIHGGLREDIKTLGNFQICEPRDHMLPVNDLAMTDADSYHSVLCGESGIDPETSLLLLTAADMHNAAISEEKVGGLTLRLVCTAGVESNAVRAGDSAPLTERENGFHSLGTINLIVCLDSPLSAGAHIQALITATEAKTAALQELLVPSRYSRNLATGTGTDGIALACVLDAGKPLTDAGTHTGLGELIGTAVKKGIKQALALQNGLTPDSIRSVGKQAARIGMDEKALIDGVCLLLDPAEAAVFRANAKEVLTNPMVFAAFSGLVHCTDLNTYGIIPKSHLRELMVRFAAQVATAVSGDDGTFEDYLKVLDETGAVLGDHAKTEEMAAGLTKKALAVGYSGRWKL